MWPRSDELTYSYSHVYWVCIRLLLTLSKVTVKVVDHEQQQHVELFRPNHQTQHTKLHSHISLTVLIASNCHYKAYSVPIKVLCNKPKEEINQFIIHQINS